MCQMIPVHTSSSIHYLRSARDYSIYCSCTVYLSRAIQHKDPVQLDAGPMPSSAWAGWIYFESPVKVEAANGVPYRRLIIRAVQLWYEVYSSCGGEGIWCIVLYRRHSLNFQYPVRAEPLVILTSLWFSIQLPQEAKYIACWPCPTFYILLNKYFPAD